MGAVKPGDAQRATVQLEDTAAGVDGGGAGCVVEKEITDFTILTRPGQARHFLGKADPRTTTAEGFNSFSATHPVGPLALVVTKQPGFLDDQRTIQIAPNPSGGHVRVFQEVTLKSSPPCQ